MAQTNETTHGSNGNGTSTSDEKTGIRAKAQNLKDQVSAKAQSATSRVGERIESVSQAVRDRAPEEGRIGDAASAVADRLQRVGSYLQEQQLNAITADVAAVIKRHPVQSMLVGVGIGYLVGRLFSGGRD